MNANIASCLLICTTLKGASFDKLNGGLNQIEELLKGIDGGEPGEPQHLADARKSWEKAALMERLDAEKEASDPEPRFSASARQNVNGARVKLASGVQAYLASQICIAAIKSGIWSDVMMEKDNA